MVFTFCCRPLNWIPNCWGSYRNPRDLGFAQSEFKRGEVKAGIFFKLEPSGVSLSFYSSHWPRSSRRWCPSPKDERLKNCTTRRSSFWSQGHVILFWIKVFFSTFLVGFILSCAVWLSFFFVFRDWITQNQLGLLLILVVK